MFYIHESAHYQNLCATNNAALNDGPKNANNESIYKHLVNLLLLKYFTHIAKIIHNINKY